MGQVQTKKIVTPVFRVSYPYVFESRFNTLSKKQEFSVVMLFDKATEDLKELRAVCKQVATERWGPQLPANLRSPFKDGDEDNRRKIAEGKLPNDSQAGMIFVQAKSIYMPGLIDATKQPILDKNEFYGGCFARAQVNVFAYPKKGVSGISPGLSIGLLHLQKIKDGPPFGNRTRAEDAFAPIESDEADDFLHEQPAADRSANNWIE